MGWLWSSSSEQAKTATDDEHLKTAEPPVTNTTFALTEEQRLRIFGKGGTKQSPETGSSKQAQEDRDLESFLNSLSTSDDNATSSPSVSDAEKARQQELKERIAHNRYHPDGSLNIHPDIIYPRTMSCRQAFDQAFYCQSLGGKFNDVYRYGSIQPCSEQWGAFWFCMRTRALPTLEREERIKEHYQGRDERRKKEFGSSEDIWEIRVKAVEQAFHKDPNEAE